jgi:uncharacterized protein YjbI with pentapeptide repeats
MKPSELKVVLEDHRLWVKSDYKQGKRADLYGADLYGADLQRADLREANLQRANLRIADLRCANLQDANLQDANLLDANLLDANLRNANLRNANLQYANLYGADLQGATFDLNFKQVGWFADATFSEDQIAWVCLHPNYPEWADSLKWVKAEKLSA